MLVASNIDPMWAAVAGIGLGVVGNAAGRVLWGRLQRHRAERLPRVAVAHASLPEQHETWGLLNEEARHLLDCQRSAAERIETKAALVIGAALAATQFVAKEPRESYWLPLAMGGFVSAIVFGLGSVLPRRFDNVGLEEMMRGVWWWNLGRASAELANNRNVAIKANARRHQVRVIWFWLSLTALGIGAIMSVGHLTLGRSTDDRRRLNGICTPGLLHGWLTSHKRASLAGRMSHAQEVPTRVQA